MIELSSPLQKFAVEINALKVKMQDSEPGRRGRPSSARTTWWCIWRMT